MYEVGGWCPALTELDLTDSYLHSVRDLGHNWPALRVLRLKRCALTDLDGLELLSRTRGGAGGGGGGGGLVLLDVRSNHLTDLSAVSACTQLQTLLLDQY